MGGSVSHSQSFSRTFWSKARDLAEFEFPPSHSRPPKAPTEGMAVGLLTEWLRSREWAPSDGLSALFAEAGRLLPHKRNHEPLITTRLLFFAVAQLGAQPSDIPEQYLLADVAALFKGRGGLFESLWQEYFERARPGATKPAPSVIGFSPKVERLLENAIAAASDGLREARLLGTADLLAVFPPEGSKAELLLRSLGVDSGELHRIARTPNERVSTHADEPASYDELGREAFADILAERIFEAWEAGKATKDAGAFIVHLHGPWGSGKSSVLNFLEANLARRPERWIVVKFNAWRDQRLQPPWWRLITTIYADARAQLGWRAPWLWLRWLSWRVRADYVPLIAVILFALLLLSLLWWGSTNFGSEATTAAGGGPSKGFDLLVRLAPLAVTLVGAIYLGSRTLALGSRRAAQTYAELKDDPFRPIAKLFNDLVRAIRRPVVVFVDDLDRCDGKYVVELLEGIQTLMRRSPVTYVVAADRKWICSSFEQRYEGFTKRIGEDGRPLGYLFLDKLFQVSAAIPQIPSDLRDSYWARLLSPEPPDLRKQQAELKEAEKFAREQAGRWTTQEDLQAVVRQAESSGDEVRLQAVRAACAKRISSPQAIRVSEHRLQPFAKYLEPNPRAMKRLVNAFAMHQATLILAGRDTPLGPLARWTILELRWPLLADFLAARPECVDSLRRRLPDGDLPQVPPALRNLFGDSLVQEVIGGEDEEDRLTSVSVESILGAVQGDR